MATTRTSADQALRDAVIRQLEWDPQVDALPIVVSAPGDIVTLSGCVETLTAKLEAERAVQEVAGVTEVVNDLEVRIYRRQLLGIASRVESASQRTHPRRRSEAA
jgi:osmotically-inducible protein OsmY